MACANCEEQSREDDEEADCAGCELSRRVGALTGDEHEVWELWRRLNSQLTYDFGLAPAVFQLAGPKPRARWGEILDQLAALYHELQPDKPGTKKPGDDE